MDYSNYQDHYSKESFFDTIRTHFAQIPFAREALALYFCLTDQSTPIWVKSLIIGGLGYVVMPLDAIPDVVPVVGWSDDLAVIGLIISSIQAHLREEHWQQADEWIKQNTD